MNEKRKTELKKYLLPKIGGLILGAAILLLSIIAMTVAASAAGILLIGIVLAALCSWKSIANLIRWNAFLNTLESDADSEVLLNDFENGVRMMEDSLRLGEKYIAGKHGVVMFRYEEITRVYEYIHRTNLAIDNHELRIVDNSGETCSLCQLPPKVEQQDVLNVFLLMKARNNGIQLGYNR